MRSSLSGNASKKSFDLFSFCKRTVSSRGFLPILLIVYIIFLTYGPGGPLTQPTSARTGTSFEPEVMPGGALYDRLVVVACHAVVRVSELPNAKFSDGAWYLLDYQKNQGFPAIITSHIQTGLDELAQDSSALLIFSGGETRGDVGPMSEAASYYYAAETLHGGNSAIKSRIFLEEYARDSFENLLFAICRFKEVSGHYPRHVTVVGFDFKAERFSTLHRSAIGYPLHAFDYKGLRAPAPFDQQHAVEGERTARASFDTDLYGCRGNLRTKRRARDPFHRTVPYELSSPELIPLLEWCGPGLFRGMSGLPWVQYPQSRYSKVQHGVKNGA